MTDAPQQSELEFAIDVARRAGERTLRHFREGVRTETKADATPVTEADREAERLCRELIEEAFPADGILGEEYGEQRPGARRRWIIDPIDGTRSFVRGVPLYGVLIALEIDGEARLGVIHFPALAETVAAARGLGCWCNGSRARVSQIDRIDRALLLSTDAESFAAEGHGDRWRHLASSVELARTWGDCYGHALVATGRAEAMIDPVLAAWDAAPLQPIIEEAGGVFTDWQGRATHRGGAGIATNRALAAAVREALGVTGSGAASAVAE